MSIRNTRGILSSLCPSTTGEVQLYVIPASTEIDAVLRVCNQNSDISSFSIAHCVSGHGDNIAEARDFIFFETEILAKSTYELSIHAKSAETIRVQSGTANKISFHLSGNSKVII